MFDIGWSEMAVVLLVALIVIGPKDLPRVARTMGQWVGKGRAMAREFQRALEDMAREAELDKVKNEIEKAARTDVGKTIEKSIDPSGELSKAFDPARSSMADGRQANGDQKAGALPQRAEDSSAPAAAGPESAAPAGHGGDVAEAPKETGREPSAAAPARRKRRAPAGNGGGVAEAPKEAGREPSAAAPAGRKRRAPAGNGGGAAEDTKKTARAAAPAEPT